MEIVTSWMKQGELKIIKRQIQVKIGEIAPQVMERISKLPEPKLEDLSEAFLDFSTEENAEDLTEEESNFN